MLFLSIFSMFWRFLPEKITCRLIYPEMSTLCRINMLN